MRRLATRGTVMRRPVAVAMADAITRGVVMMVKVTLQQWLRLHCSDGLHYIATQKRLFGFFYFTLHHVKERACLCMRKCV
jgi:hypothetical protein